MNIKNMMAEERPREKLLQKGPEALDNSELLAILLRTGTKKQNAVETARELLACADNKLSILGDFSTERMKETQGIGNDKAATIAAALELGKRFIVEERIDDKCSITSPRQVFHMMQPMLKGLSHEECWIVFLNRANYVIGKEMISSGGMSATVLDNRLIIRKALEKNAQGLILIHNHPSGNPRPGTSDIKQTESLKKAASCFDISLIDHLVIADNRFYSFADEQVW